MNIILVNMKLCIFIEEYVRFSIAAMVFLQIIISKLFCLFTFQPQTRFIFYNIDINTCIEYKIM